MYGVGGGGRRGSTKKRKKAAPAENFFEKLTVAELKELLRAAGDRVSGTKGDLVGRLCENNVTARYASNVKRSRFSIYTGEMSGSNEGLSTEQLKEELVALGVKSSGKKYDLVLRLVQNRDGVKAKDISANVVRDKSGSVLRDANGAPAKKPRAKSTKATPIEKLIEQVKRKIEADKSKWSNQRYKNHYGDCCNVIAKILHTEIVEKEMIDRGEYSAAMNLIKVLHYDIVMANERSERDITGWGYGDQQFMVYHRLENMLPDIVENLSRDELVKHRVWMVDMVKHLSSYGVEEEMKKLVAIVDEALEVEEEEDEEESEEEKSKKLSKATVTA